jgi:hypothetical protein
MEHPQYVIATCFLRHIKKENFEYYWAASLILVEIKQARSRVRLRPAVRRVKFTENVCALMMRQHANTKG